MNDRTRLIINHIVNSQRGSHPQHLSPDDTLRKISKDPLHTCLKLSAIEKEKKDKVWRQILDTEMQCAQSLKDQVSLVRELEISIRQKKKELLQIQKHVKRKEILIKQFNRESKPILNAFYDPLQELPDVKDTARPGKLFKAYLDHKIKYSLRQGVHDVPIDLVARLIGVREFNDLYKFDNDQMVGILEVLRLHDFARNSYLRGHLEDLIASGVILDKAGSFDMNRIHGHSGHSPDTLRGLLAIYLNVRPDDMTGFTLQSRRNALINCGNPWRSPGQSFSLSASRTEDLG